MYQSVGTTIPPLIAEAMGLPHYSRVIKGGAVEQGAEYGSREHGGEGSGQEGDETEDLTALLKTIIVSSLYMSELTIRLSTRKSPPSPLEPSSQTTSACA